MFHYFEFEFSHTCDSEEGLHGFLDNRVNILSITPERVQRNHEIIDASFRSIEFLANFIIRNFDVICRANDFVNLPYFVLVKVIESSNSIRLVHEDNLFLAIHRWLMHDPPDRHCCLNDLLAGFSFINDELLNIVSIQKL